jgi:hypothetical protein
VTFDQLIEFQIHAIKFAAQKHSESVAATATAIGGLFSKDVFRDFSSRITRIIQSAERAFNVDEEPQDRRQAMIHSMRELGKFSELLGGKA